MRMKVNNYVNIKKEKIMPRRGFWVRQYNVIVLKRRSIGVPNFENKIPPLFD
jgi:hypothetical protein